MWPPKDFGGQPSFFEKGRLPKKGRGQDSYLDLAGGLDPGPGDRVSLAILETG